MAPGPEPAISDEGSLNVGDGCTLEYTRYRPDGESGEALVILTHGFARGPGRMQGWASHWASWGAEVVTPQMCFLRFVNTDHEANGRHLVQLADQLADGRPVIFAGHSAGGLAATLAAAEVEGSALLALDPVDSDQLGETAAEDLTGPVAALFAEPSDCNADSNGESMLAAVGDKRWWRIRDADHCDFESPTNRGCTFLCRDGEADRQAIQRAILGLTTGYIHWQGGLDERGEAWWTQGDPYFEQYAELLRIP